MPTQALKQKKALPNMEFETGEQASKHACMHDVNQLGTHGLCVTTTVPFKVGRGKQRAPFSSV